MLRRSPESAPEQLQRPLALRPHAASDTDVRYPVQGLAMRVIDQGTVHADQRVGGDPGSNIVCGEPRSEAMKAATVLV